MELTWYGRTCIRLRGRDAVVVADPYTDVVGPTGRGITGEVVTFSSDTLFQTQFTSDLGGAAVSPPEAGPLGPLARVRNRLVARDGGA